MAEKEYIERGALIAELQEELEFDTPMYTNELTLNLQNEYVNRGLKIAIKDTKCIPAADVVEVVRCIECIHRDKKGVCEKFRQRYPFFPEDDFYCGFGAKMDGKRKEQE